MPDLNAALERLRAHAGVHAVILLGRDGLVVAQPGEHFAAAEAIAARVPGLLGAGEALGRVAGQGECRTLVTEFSDGVAIIAALPDELLLLLLLEPGVGFAPLLREVRQQREYLAALL